MKFSSVVSDPVDLFQLILLASFFVNACVFVAVYEPVVCIVISSEFLTGLVDRVGLSGEFIFNAPQPEIDRKRAVVITVVSRVVINEDFNESKFSNLIIRSRAKHVVTENQRVLEAKKYLLENNIDKFGQLMNESHTSYSKDFEASTEDVDIITKKSIEAGAVGSRLTGGGFGGFTVSLITNNNYEKWYNKMKNHYSEDIIYKV